MGLFRKQSAQEKRLREVFGLVGAAAGQVTSGRMPHGYFEDLWVDHQEEIVRLHAAVTADAGPRAAAKAVD